MNTTTASSSLKNRKFLLIAFVLNLIIVFFETIGLVLSIHKHGIKVFQFYTENSNYFSLIASFIFCINCVISLKRNKPISYWVNVVRYVSATSLAVTFFIVLTVLIPVRPNTTLQLLFGRANLFQHTLCPILSVVSFIIFESETKLKKTVSLFHIIPTIVYGLICILLNITKTIVGPYPFFYIYELPSGVVTLFLLGVLIIITCFAFLLLWLRNKQYNKKR